MLQFSRRTRHDWKSAEAPTGDAASTPGPDRAASTTEHLHSLGLAAGANRNEIERAHRRLVSDLTPGPGASHRNVALANRLLDEVNLAYEALRTRSEVA